MYIVIHRLIDVVFRGVGNKEWWDPSPIDLSLRILVDTDVL